jgi:hypothetical protein
MGARPAWLQALIFFVIFVPVWLLFNIITGDGFSGAEVVNAIITGAIAALIYGVIMYFYLKRKNRA